LVEEKTSPSPPPSVPRLRALAYPLAVAALACALYAPTWRYGFQWDDKSMIVEHSSFSAIRSIGQVLTTPFRAVFGGASAGQPYYRPVSLGLLVAEFSAFGANPTGYRIVHAALHVACCVLLYAVLLALVRAPGGRTAGAGARRAAAFGAALFAVAPYGVDTVLFLTSAGDQLVLASSLAALLAGAALCRGRGVGAALALLVASTVCVFSKENGAVLPALIAAYCAALGLKLRSLRFAAALGIALLSAAGLIAARFALIHEAQHISEPAFWGRALGGLGMSARFSVGPHPFGMEREVPATAASAAAIAGAAVLAALAFFAWRWRRRPDALFGPAFWFLTLAPSLVAVANTGVLSARYLYLPAAGLACLGASACAAWRRPAFLSVAGLASAWLAFAALRVFAWSSDYRLWSREVELNPERATSWVHLGDTTLRLGDLPKAESALRHAAALCQKSGNRHAEAYARTDLCTLLVARAQMDAALVECKAAVTADAGYAGGWLALGNLHAADSAWDKALRAYQEAMAQDPGEYGPIVLAAGAAAALGERLVAMSLLDAAKTAAAGDPDKRADYAQRRALVLEQLRGAGSTPR
jgi:tetratricopeptide (TPR) repeat protein